MSNVPAIREDLRPGMLVYKWHDSGWGADPMYADVVRVNRVTATIRWLQTGIVMRLPFHHLHVETHPEMMRRELKAEYTAITQKIADTLTVPAYDDLPPLAVVMLGIITAATLRGGYIASWEISRALPGAADLNVVCDDTTPGNAALRALLAARLVEELPKLRYRYRLCRG